MGRIRSLVGAVDAVPLDDHLDAAGGPAGGGAGGGVVGGAVITETVFAYPGLGRVLLEGILDRDYAVVQASVIIVALAYVLMNLLVDILYVVIDPRVRQL